MKIIYKNKDNTISILHPTEEALSFATVFQVAEKDVPVGLPYWIVEDEAIPTDRSERNAWEWNSDIEPDGIGGELNEFPDGVVPNDFNK